MAVTLGLEGDERDKVSARLWDAVDRRLKLEAGPGVDCLLTRVQSRLVHSCGKRRFALQQLSAHGQCDRVSQTRTNTRIHEIMGLSLTLMYAGWADGLQLAMSIGWTRTLRGWLSWH